MTRIPKIFYVISFFSLALLILPVVSLFWRLDWSRLADTLGSDEAQNAIWLSIRTASFSTFVCVCAGIPLALVMARSQDRIAAILRTIVAIPLVLPPLVGGIALLFLLGKNGLFGGWFDLIGVRIPFTTVAVIIAQCFVALPFLVITVEGALRSSDTRFETVAMTLGAGKFTVFRRVTLPLVAPGVLSGVVLCFARAIGEFGATAIFAGNSESVTRTMPLAIYSAFNGTGIGQDVSIALSFVLMCVCVAVLFLARAWRRDIRS